MTPEQDTMFQYIDLLLSQGLEAWDQNAIMKILVKTLRDFPEKMLNAPIEAQAGFLVTLLRFLHEGGQIYFRLTPKEPCWDCNGVGLCTKCKGTGELCNADKD